MRPPIAALIFLLALAACAELPPAPALEAFDAGDDLIISVEGDRIQWLQAHVDGVLVADIQDPPFTTTIAKADYLPGSHVLLVVYKERGIEISVTLGFTTPYRPLFPNEPPTLTLSVPTAGTVGEPLPVSIAIEDDGRPYGILLGTWGVIGPSLVYVNDPDSTSTTVTFPTAGEWIVRYVVTDGEIEVAAEGTVVIE